ncbi:acyltransferase family protein [Sphingomonas baiyangensis]|uniref:acyltransferase family protein n=1 Tax=Sphingomonas baiyangensis TaxID=2572576 RepID=UPI00146F0BF3|nr:acyltransferase [Sphingomonas baiyangensis]
MHEPRDTGAAKAGFLPDLQIARFVAAFIVMWGHLQHETKALGIATQGALIDFAPIYYPSGVDIFFVISGFIMYLLGRDRFGEPGFARTFLTRRLIRIVPLYWLFLFAMLGAITLFGGRMNNTNLDGAHIVSSFLFVPWPRIDGNVVPVLSSGWTLNYEMLFYAIFATGLLFSRRQGMTIVVGALIALFAIGQIVPESWFVLRFWGKSIILEFLLGMALAHFYLRGIRLPRWAAIALIAAGFAMLVVANDVQLVQRAGRFVGAGIAAAFIVAGFVLSARPSSGPVARGFVEAGDASYALYLSHPFTLNLLAIVWERLGIGSPALFFGSALLLCVLVSIAIYRLLERPVIAWLNARAGGRRSEAVKQF